MVCNHCHSKKDLIKVRQQYNSVSLCRDYKACVDRAVEKMKLPAYSRKNMRTN